MGFIFKLVNLTKKNSIGGRHLGSWVTISFASGLANCIFGSSGTAQMDKSNDGALAVFQRESCTTMLDCQDVERFPVKLHFERKLSVDVNVGLRVCALSDDIRVGSQFVERREKLEYARHFSGGPRN